MAFSFTVPKPIDLKATFTKVTKELAKVKGSLNGDETSGSITSSGVEGVYVVGANSIEITINRKPFYASNATVEKEIKKLFANINQ